MRKAVETLLMLCLTTTSVLAWTSCDSNYIKINSYLVDNTGTIDTKMNLNTATEMFKIEMGKVSNANKMLLNALRQFLSLIELDGTEKCKKDGYFVLLANDKATGSLAKKATAPYRRVERIIFNSAIKHAVDCKEVYATTLKDKYLSMDKILVSRVHLYTDEIIMIDHLNSGYHLSVIDSLNLWRRYVSEGKISVEGYGQTLYDSIYFLSKGDPDRLFLSYVTDEKRGNRSIRKDKVEELFDRYIIKPCEYYVHELGADLFLPATYDGLLHKKESDIEDSKRPLYWSWSRFKICRALIEQDRKAAIKEVIRVAQESKS